MKGHKKLKLFLKSLMNRLPYVRTLHRLNSNSKFPAGHFYSSVVSLEEIRFREKIIWPENTKDKVEGIDLNVEEQLNFINVLATFYDEMNFPEEKKEGWRYFLKNTYYSYNDGIILYSFLRYFKPKRIIEIGSGLSSALMVDVNEHFFNGKIELTFIEPFPEDRLLSLVQINCKSNTRLVSKRIQDIHLDEFKILEPGDIMFIDSSHVVKTGSDVNYILFEILPVLKNGVLLHFHDIYYPFEYPKSWVLDGFGWNEAYFLRSFLMYNSSFKILFFSDYLHKYYSEVFKKMPLVYKSTGSSLWLEKSFPEKNRK